MLPERTITCKTSVLISISCAQNSFLMSHRHIAYSTVTKNNICNTCLESDYGCVCLTCDNHKAIAPVSKQTKSKKKSQIEWICCTSCSKWIHPICFGPTYKKIQKLTSFSNKSQLDLFCKCFKCSLKTAGITDKNFIKQDPSSTQTSPDNITKIDVSVDTQHC